ncbi:keratin, type I cytoskeletal 9-like isoform X2 [Athalia rosae]|uniref:keratin, type I cytoskeletal 9-like isoform X2 n=1 Tax=Athalia rosae TaxID=37344 RepID=UPI00203385A0|nr:keratin, type I cytoskeletal 9-like isoform X2 [Athalia rosae]
MLLIGHYFRYIVGILIAVRSVRSVLTKSNGDQLRTLRSSPTTQHQDDVEVLLDKNSGLTINDADRIRNLSSMVENFEDDIRESSTTGMKEDHHLQGRKQSQPFKNKEKKPRTFFGPLSLDLKDKFYSKRGIIYDTRDSFDAGGFTGGLSCCGTRYGLSGYSQSDRRPNVYGYGDSSDGGRYPDRPSRRPGADRYGSSYSQGLTGGGLGRPEGDLYGSGGSGGSYPSRYGPIRGGSYGGGSDGDRYGGTRPSFGGGPPSGPGAGSSGLYGRPSFSAGGSNSYGGFGSQNGGSAGAFGSGYGAGAGSYGAGGSGGYEGGGGGGGISGGFGTGGFGGGSFGGGSGIGGFGSYDHFGGGGDYGVGDGGGGMGLPSEAHIKTQKALALKALAGVALIGAAAALATNPVLLPLGVAHGRKKRSAADDFWNEHPLMLLKGYISQIPRSDIKKEDILVLSKFLASRKCVAKLACEIQREYFADLARYKDVGDRENRGENSIYHNLEQRFMDFNVLNNSYVNEHLKKEIKLALAIGARDGNCKIFPCALSKE